MNATPLPVFLVEDVHPSENSEASPVPANPRAVAADEFRELRVLFRVVQFLLPFVCRNVRLRLEPAYLTAQPGEPEAVTIGPCGFRAKSSAHDHGATTYDDQPTEKNENDAVSDDAHRIREVLLGREANDISKPGTDDTTANG